MKKGYIVFLILFVLLTAAGCGKTPEKQAEALQAKDVYVKSIKAMELVNAVGFTMDMTQKMQFPASIPVSEGPENNIEMQLKSSGRMVQDPLAMEMDITLMMPGLAELEELGNIKMKMYLVGNQIYIFEPMFEQWVLQDMSEYGFDLEQSIGINQAGSDPMYYLKLLGEDGSAEAALKKEGTYNIITVTDKDGVVLDKLIDEVMGQFEALLGVPVDGETENLFSNLTFSDFTYEMWVEDGTYYTTKIVMSYKMTMTVEGETVSVEQSTVMTYKDFGAFTNIEVPQDVKASAVSMDDMLNDITIPE